MSLDLTKPVQTRDGRKAKVICSYLKNPDYPLAAIVVNEYGNEVVETYTKTGSQIVDRKTGWDLINVDEQTNGHD